MPSSSQIPAEIRELVLANFLLQEPESFFETFENWRHRAGFATQIVEAFKKNLNSAIVVCTIPFTMTNSATHQRHFMPLLFAEQIERGFHAENPPSSEDLAAATKAAEEAFSQRLSDEEFRGAIAYNITASLRGLLYNSEMKSAAQELLRQTAVMVWGALEVIATDIAIEVLNRKPSLVSEALTTETMKRLGLSRNVSFDLLKEFKYDVSTSMGNILFAERRLDSLPALAALCADLYKNQELDIQLKSEIIWTLAQRRHLIVHRRGIVDAQYLSRTSDSIQLGQSLLISPDQIRKYLYVVRDIGLTIAESALALCDTTA